MSFKLVTLLAAATSALGLTITGPSPSLFWVQFTSNNITWNFANGDPSPVDIQVVNSNNTILNGPFAIARSVETNNGSFTVTNVTLVVATGYTVNFVNSTNPTQVFAQSQPFSVDAPGTPPATVSSSAPASTATSPSNSSSNGTTPGSSGNSTSPSGGKNATSSDAMSLFSNGLPVYFISTAGMVLAGAAAVF